jgi:hypothetical protein
MLVDRGFVFGKIDEQSLVGGDVGLLPLHFLGKLRQRAVMLEDGHGQSLQLSMDGLLCPTRPSSQSRYTSSGNA